MANTLIHTLSRPVEFEGNKYEVLTVDFDSLTGRDIKQAKKDFDRVDRVAPVLMMDVEFGAYLAARAAKIPVAVMDYLPAGDYMALGQSAVNFLLASGYSREEAAQIREAQQQSQESLSS